MSYATDEIMDRCRELTSQLINADGFYDPEVSVWIRPRFKTFVVSVAWWSPDLRTKQFAGYSLDEAFALAEEWVSKAERATKMSEAAKAAIAAVQAAVAAGVELDDIIEGARDDQA